jgi:pilus assembly protein CpaE
MLILLACDCPIKAARLRQALERLGYDCPLGNVVPVEAAGNARQKPDLLILVLPAEQEQAHAVVKRLRESVDVPILAVGARDPNLILIALRAGANDFVDGAGDLESELKAALTRLSATSARGRSSRGQLVTVVAASGGTGRTLMATNLAVTLAKAHGRCILLDFDLGAGDVATLLDLKPRHTVADLCRNLDKLDQKMFEQSLLEHATGVNVLAAPESWDAVADVTVEGLERILKYGRTLFPTVVVDLDAFWLSEYAHLLQESSKILLLCRLDLSTIRNTRRALDYFDHIHVDRDRVMVIAARCGRAKEISVGQAESVLNVRIEHSVPEDASTANSCVNCGVPLVVESPTCSIAKAIASIAKSATHPTTTPAINGASVPDEHLTMPVIEKVRAFLGMSEGVRAHRAAVTD